MRDAWRMWARRAWDTSRPLAVVLLACVVLALAGFLALTVLLILCA